MRQVKLFIGECLNLGKNLGNLTNMSTSVNNSHIYTVFSNLNLSLCPISTLPMKQ